MYINDGRTYHTNGTIPTFDNNRPITQLVGCSTNITVCDMSVVASANSTAIVTIVSWPSPTSDGANEHGVGRTSDALFPGDGGGAVLHTERFQITITDHHRLRRGTVADHSQSRCIVMSSCSPPHVIPAHAIATPCDIRVYYCGLCPNQFIRMRGNCSSYEWHRPFHETMWGLIDAACPWGIGLHF